MVAALDGLKIIDFGQYIAAPLAAMVLCDNGAEVIRIDPPGGPKWSSPANAVLQRGKKSIVLNLKRPDDNAVARKLIAGADVVLEGFRPGVMARLGLGPEEMVSVHPELVYCSIPGFGRDDPRAALAGWEGIVGAAAALHAKSGNSIIASSGAGSAFPIFNALPVASTYAALIASSSIVAALIARLKSGRGQIIEVPLFDAVFEGLGVLAQRLPPYAPNSAIHGALDGVYQCADGVWIYICMPTPEFWARLGKTFMGEDWYASELHDTRLLARDPEKAQEAIQYLRDMFRTRPAAEWDALANQASLNFTICKTTAEWLGEDQSSAAGATIDLEDPEFGPTRQLGYTHYLSKTPPRAATARRKLNSDSASIRQSLTIEHPRARSGSGRTGAEPAAAPLQGIRVVDTSHYLAGPTCGRILAEFGAEVIKIDAPNRPIVGFLHVNSGKKTALVDVKTDEGLNLVKTQLADADVFIESFSPGTADKIGLGEEEVRKIKPDIIYASINCYGLGGPRAKFHGVEAVAQSITGMAARWGGAVPKMQRLLVCDYGAGHLSALGVLIALFWKMTAGEGQLVQTSLVQAAMFHQAVFAIDYAGRVWDEPAGPEARGWGGLDRLYEASDGWLYLVAPDDLARRALDQVEGLGGAAGLDGEPLVDWLTRRFATETVETWCARIAAANIAIHPVMDFETLLNSKVVRDRGLVISRHHEGLGEVRSTGALPKLSLTPVRTTAPVAVPGTDTTEIVTRAGLVDQLDEMLKRGVVAQCPVEETFLWL